MDIENVDIGRRMIDKVYDVSMDTICTSLSLARSRSHSPAHSLVVTHAPRGGNDQGQGVEGVEFLTGGMEKQSTSLNTKVETVVNWVFPF